MSILGPESLALIDGWETLRGWLLEKQPELEESLRPATTVEDQDWTATPPRERLTLAIITILDLKETTPVVRRNARKLLVRLEDEGFFGEEEGSGLVREGPLPEIEDLKPAVLEKLIHDLRFIDSARFQQQLKAAAGPVAAMALVEKQSKSLRNNRASRFLSLINYPITVPDLAKRRWLHRMGFMSKVEQTKGNRDEALRAIDEYSRSVGSTPQQVGAVLDAFVGNLASAKATVSLCLAKPKCDECPILNHCEYGSFLQKHGVQESEEPQLGSRLADRYLPEDRPREKLVKIGPGGLSNSELLAILLRTGSGQEHAVDLANRLIRDAGSLDRLGRYSVAEMTRFPGLGPVKAVTIMAALELARRFGDSAQKELVPIGNARTVFEHFRGYFLERKKEQFLCLLLDTKNRMYRHLVVSEGTLNQSLVHPREAFQEAIRDSANGVVFVHNHPSGDPTPSRDDKAITARLVDVGKVIGIRVLDHVIIGSDDYFSFADHGILEGTR